MKKASTLVAALALVVALALVAHRTRLGGAAPRRAAAAAADNAGKPAAPDFTIKDIHGADVSLAQFKGKVVLVNFWATWCGPCRIEMPWMIEFQNTYGPKGFTVLGVAMDEEGKQVVEPYIRDTRFNVDGQKLPVNYPILIGNDEVGDKFGGLLGLPTSVLISRDGKKAKTFIGLVDHDKIVKEIEAQLASH